MSNRTAAADGRAFQKRRSDLLQNEEFVDWLRWRGYGPNFVTQHVIDEFDEFQLEKFLAGPQAFDGHEVDPSRIDAEIWNASVDEWMREGHEEDSVPVAPQEWIALLRRRVARLKAKRRLAVHLLIPPKQSLVVVSDKDILDAQAALKNEREEIVDAWNEKHEELPDEVKTAWNFYHDDDQDLDIALRTRSPNVRDLPADPTDIRAIESGRAHPEYSRFQTFSDAVLQRLKRLKANLEQALNPPADSRPPLKGWSLDEIDEDEDSVWPVPTIIPRGLAFVYGLPKSGKSLWVQKLSVCIAGGVPFDGIEKLEHGRVLYVTRDIGASRQEVKKRFIKMLPHLDLPKDALNGKLILTDDPFYLNEPGSVDNLLTHNPGRFVLVVIDSLFRCVNGSLLQDAVVSAAMDGVAEISRVTGAAVVAIHHEPRRGEHMFGSVMLDATYDSQIHVERGRNRDSVVVTVQELKNAAVPARSFAYRIEDGCLVAEAGAAPETTKVASTRQPEMLALLPAGWFTRKEGRKLVEPMLTGSEQAKQKQWQRAVDAMKKRGEIDVRANRLRKTS